MKPRPSMEKRRKERARQEKKQEKAERRERRKAERAERQADGVRGPEIAWDEAHAGSETDNEPAASSPSEET